METAIEFASLFPAGIQATEEDLAREAYEYLRAHLPVEMLDAALQWLQLMPPEQYLASAEASVQTFREQGYVSPPAVTTPGRPLAMPSAPIAGPNDGTAGFPLADGAAAEIPEDYKQAIAIILGKRKRPASDHVGQDAPTKRQRVNPVPLGPTEWLGDEHIEADYTLLGAERR